MKTRYYHDILGVNSRLDTIQAAVLSVKLKYLDSYNLARQNAAKFYNTAFNGIDKLKTPVCAGYSTHIYHQYTLRIINGKRDNLKEYLEKSGIPAMIYYPVPLHLQKAFMNLGYKKGDFPVSELLTSQVLSLPMHTELDGEQLNYITSKLATFFN
jgi:UDP-2-acetamido-2-deoxy-ribo-hexuluronate aminotransferase